MTKRPIVAGVTVFPRGRKFAYRLELDPDRLTGARRRTYKGGFATEEEAWSAAIKARSAHAEGTAIPASRRTVGQFLTEWLDTIRQEVKPSTHANYTDYSTAYVIPTIGGRRLQETDVPTLNAFYQHLLKNGRTKRDTNSQMYAYWKGRTDGGHEPKPSQIARECGTSIYAARAAVLRYRRGRLPVARTAGLAPKTVKNVHRMLHRALSDAVAWQYISHNPAERASLPRTGRGKKNVSTRKSCDVASRRLARARHAGGAGA